MDLLQAIFLGIVQGATEFLPVSSSGHLVLVPWWLHWAVPPSLDFTVAAHLGSLFAVLVYFRHDWALTIKGGINLFRTRKVATPESRLFVFLLIGSIPIGIVGVLFSESLKTTFQNPASAAGFLLVTAAFLLFSERKTAVLKEAKAMEAMTWRDLLCVGFAQLLAIVPGVSRSGSTIAAGLYRDINRVDAARFSFLLGAPAILGAGFIAGVDLAKSGDIASQLPLMLAGAAAAAVVGYLAIAVLLTHLRTHRLYVFAAYCAVFGLISLLAVVIGR